MKKVFIVALWLMPAIVFIGPLTSAQVKQPLKLVATTPLPGFSGDFDHFALDLKGKRLFLTAEDHKTVDVKWSKSPEKPGNGVVATNFSGCFTCAPLDNAITPIAGTSHKIAASTFFTWGTLIYQSAGRVHSQSGQERAPRCLLDDQKMNLTAN